MIYKSYIIEKSLENLDKKVVLFYGENLGLKNDFKKKIISINSKKKIHKYYQEDILKNNNLLLNEIKNLSLFEDAKVFIIEQVDDRFLELLKEYSADIKGQEIYFFSEILEKKSKIRNYFEKSKDYGCISCYKDNEMNIRQIIIERLKNFKGLSSQNINLIIENSNLDRVKLNNELEKIVTYFEKKEIETNKLQHLLDQKINEDFNILKDFALMGNKEKTNKLLSDTVVERDKNIYYLNLINLRLKIIKDLHKLQEKNLDKAIDLIKPPIFWKDKANFKVQAKKWNIRKINKLMKDTYNLEIHIKQNSVVDKNILLKKLMVDICSLANS